MQKTLLALLMGSAIVLPVASHAEGSYLKLGVGQSRYSGDPPANPKGAMIAYGMKLDPSLDVEIGYIDFGPAKLNFTVADISGEVRTKTRTFYAAGIGNFPISQRVSFQGKLGLGVHRTNSRVGVELADTPLGGETGGTRTRVLLGAGLNMQFTKEVSGGVEYTYYGKSSDGTELSMINAALRYHF